ncbi:hypothetical protein ACQKDS_11940 [Serratia sp. NPDC078593]|uniref:hypothetical protein n=1 Tax=unclassified Serratia (in: enterobacteria) TaxID=2647522 RepID=UPI0037D0B076
MNKNKIALLMLGAIIFSANTFAGTISSKEQAMRNTVTKCISDIQQSQAKNSQGEKTILDVIYGYYGGAYKFCGSAAEKTRTAIAAGHDQQEKWEAEFQDLYSEYQSIPQEDKNKPNALNIMKKIRALMVPNKLDARHAQSKLVVYRTMMQEIDKLEALLPSIEGQ